MAQIKLITASGIEIVFPKTSTDYLEPRIKEAFEHPEMEFVHEGIVLESMHGVQMVKKQGGDQR